MAEASNTQFRSCGQCSKASPIPREGLCLAHGCSAPRHAKGLCTRHYQRQRDGVPFVRQCVQCGADTKNRKFCSARCRQRAADAKYGPGKQARRREETKARLKPTTCHVCQSVFIPSFISQSMYCSKSCCKKAYHARKFGTLPEKVRSEVAALKRMAKRAGKRLAKVQAIRLRRVRLIADKTRRAEHVCSDCGVSLSGQLKLLRCPTCSEARNRKAKRTYRAAYKARLRYQSVEIFDPLEVLERDGWRCHICGIKTPKRLRGTYEDNAPELDHIIPLAAGGEHSRRNTACSCRKCNIEKADKPLGQMRLVA